MAPYIITIAEATNSVLAIYRNWEIGDESLRRLDWITQYNYITWRSVSGIGFAEILDGVAAATTGSLRALLDSATAANFPTLLASKGAKIVGQNTNVSPGQVTQVEGVNGMVSKLSDQIMPLQLGQPQPILMQLMEYLDTKVHEFYNTTSGALENVGDETPVGTTLALIEEGSKRYAAINARLHESQKQFFAITNRIFKHNLDEQCIIDELGELVISRYDFEFEDIEVVSDPRIFSEAQRYALNQATLQLAAQAPQLYNMPELHFRTLQSLGVQDIDKILNVPSVGGKLNAVAENIACLEGNAIQAFTNQNHMAHLVTHLQFMMNPIYGQNPANAPKMMVLLTHMQEHITMLYGQVMNEALIQVGGEQYKILDGESIPAIDKDLSKLNTIVLAQVQKMLAPYMDSYTKVSQQILQANQPPQSPEQMQMQMKQQELQQNQQETQAKLQMQGKEMQTHAQLEQMKLQTETQLQQLKDNTEKLKLRNELAVATMQMESENKESASNVEIEKLRLLEAHIASAEKLRIELEKHHSGLAHASLVEGHKSGHDAIKHMHQLHTQSEISRNKPVANKGAENG